MAACLAISFNFDFHISRRRDASLVLRILAKCLSSFSIAINFVNPLIIASRRHPASLVTSGENRDSNLDPLRRRLPGVFALPSIEITETVHTTPTTDDDTDTPAIPSHPIRPCQCCTHHLCSQTPPKICWTGNYHVPEFVRLP